MNKTRLQELCQKRRWDLPQYTHSRVGMDHDSRFVASVTVNGSVFESPDAESRSAKEAQNKAAMIAFETLSNAAPAVVEVVPSPPQSPAVESFSSLPPHTESQGTYKSQLLVYAQRRHKEAPKYTTVCSGTPQTPLFKATVLIDGLSFESPKCFKTVKEAEHAAAEVALASLPKEESSQQNLQDESGVPYKTLLQEFVQKSKQLLPVYTTVTDPNSLPPAFSSTVKVCGRAFKGEVAKTKKQAEASAAKVAWDHIKERKQFQVASNGSASPPMNGTLTSCSSNMTSKPTISPSSLSPPIRDLTMDQVLPGNEISATQDSRPLPAHPRIAPIQLTKECNLDSAANSNLELTANSIYYEGHVLTVMKEPNEPTNDVNLDLAAQSNLGLTANTSDFEGHVLTAMKEPIEPTKDCNLNPAAQLYLGSAVNSIYSEGHVSTAMKEPIESIKDCNLDPAAQLYLGSAANSIYSEGNVSTAMKEPIESIKDCNLDPAAQLYLGSAANSIYSEGNVSTAMKEPIESIKDCNLDTAAQLYLGSAGNSIYSKGNVSTAMKEPIESIKDCNLDPAAQLYLGSAGNSTCSDRHVCSEIKKDNSNEGVDSSLMCNKIQVFPANLHSAVPHSAVPLHFSDNTWVAVSLDFPNHGLQDDAVGL
ncbi:Double-stranded RNA-binding protein 1 [Rhynchospora pubera]|uniref:Double-stranded RNA-binding protein 1 n=1 Tax=Rhynchospora pubera TaxID=906938 RepID=A0AAV8D533_9POAL|nr:Double-stranded RNA-binding protein 1 [Rhynchospora pubera]